MKISRSRFEQIIAEELEAFLEENEGVIDEIEEMVDVTADEDQ